MAKKGATEEEDKKEAGGVGEDRRCLSAGARKVEQIRNSVFRGDMWNGNTQPPPEAICVSVQGKICQSAAC